MTWEELAACVGDLRMTSPDPDTARTVIAERCTACPVIAQCRRWAEQQTHNDTRKRVYEGVAGGMWWVNGHPKRLPYKRTDDWGTSPEDLREGHRRYYHGARDEQTLALERAYQRARMRRRRSGRAA